MAALLLKLVVALAAPAASLAARVELPEVVGDAVVASKMQAVESVYGVPRLEVLATSSDAEAAAFLRQWEEEREFGLFILTVPDSRGFFPKRVGLIGICNDNKVLLFNMKPLLRENARPLPKKLRAFMEDKRRTFFGVGILDTVAHMAFECDTVIRCVDFNVRTWQQMVVGGGLYGLANRYFGDKFEPRPKLRHMHGQAVNTYLPWALTEYFVNFAGDWKEEWVISEAEMFGAGPTYIRVERPQHSWDAARDEWKRLEKQRSATLIRERLADLKSYGTAAEKSRGLETMEGLAEVADELTARALKGKEPK